MKWKQFSEEQIIGILKGAEAGAVVTALCRKPKAAVQNTDLAAGDEPDNG